MVEEIKELWWKCKFNALAAVAEYIFQFGFIEGFLPLKDAHKVKNKSPHFNWPAFVFCINTNAYHGPIFLGGGVGSWDAPINIVGFPLKL